MPCEPTLSSSRWAWRKTIEEAPLVGAVIAAIAAGIAGLAFGQSPLQAGAQALIVFVVTFGGLFIYNYMRAPTQIERERAERLAEWRAPYDFRASFSPTDGARLSVSAAPGVELVPIRCEVLFPPTGTTWRSPDHHHVTNVMSDRGTHVTAEWIFPAEFEGPATGPAGEYMCRWLVGDHVEALGERTFEIGRRWVGR
jgi:hypothetical protein